MELKYFKPIYLARYEDSNIELEIILDWKDEEAWAWHYIIHWNGEEFLRGVIKNAHCKTITHHVRFALMRKGIDLDHIVNLRFLNKVIVPNIKYSPYHQWLMEHKDRDKILEQIEWNMSSQNTIRNTTLRQSLVL